MRVLARIPMIEADGAAQAAAEPPAAACPAEDRSPDVSSPDVSSPPIGGMPGEAAAEHAMPAWRRRAMRRECSRGRRGSAFPLTSVVALGVLAAVAWTLASWSEQQRLARHRQERLARVSQQFNAQGTTR